LTSEYWLMASLCGAFFSFFALNRGGVVIFIDACFIFLLINVIFGDYRLKRIPESYWILFAICAYLLLGSVLFSFQNSDYGRMTKLARMLCIVMTIHCMIGKRIKKWTTLLFGIVLSAAVCWQIAYYYIYKHPFGTFSSPHYFANFTVLALPIIIYFSVTANSWFKLLFIPIALLDLDLIFKIGSRPAILGIFVAPLIVITFMTKGRKKWLSLVLFGIILLSIYISNYGNIVVKFKDLLASLPKEERVQLWITSWNMLKDNNLMAWITGSGVGSFRMAFPQYSPSELMWLGRTFPHNYILEICYENGIVGLIMVCGGFLLLLVSAFQASSRIIEKNIRLFLYCLIVVLLIWSIHTGLTFSFYGKYSQYSLAFILGSLLVVIENSKDKSYNGRRSADEASGLATPWRR